MLGPRFAAALDELGSPLGAPFALAVSGGGDSVALMHLTADWLRTRGLPLNSVTVLVVDHGLRPGSARDATAAAGWAERAGFAAHILRWRGSKPRANIEDAARTARYRLLGDWCRAHGIATILLAHTRDDQAETFLLRLGRGSGLDGLSAMRGRGGFPVAGYDSIAVVRPLLGIGRDELRSYLVERSIAWLEDPMNEDPRFARVRIRRNVIPALESAGIGIVRIAQAAQHLGRAREALDMNTQRFIDGHVRFNEKGTAFLDGDWLRSQAREIGLRALSAVLMRVSGRAYRPRFERLEHLYDSVISAAPGRTLSGCRVGVAGPDGRVFGNGTVEVRREPPRRKPIEQKSHRNDRFIAASAGNSPKKRRNITRLSGS